MVYILSQNDYILLDRERNHEFIYLLIVFLNYFIVDSIYTKTKVL